MKRVRGLNELADLYDAFLVDQFGVLLDGEAFTTLRAARSTSCTRAARWFC